MLIPLTLILLNIFAWYPVLSFWFLGGWEPAWLIGICGYNFNLVCLMQSHGILMLFNYKLFGWNPTGWYLSAIILHIAAVLFIYKFTKILTKNTPFAYVVALLFGVNVAHNDVINWGSFEGLYALLMVSFLLSLFSYLRFRAIKGAYRFIWYGLSLLLFLFGLFIREIALALPFFLLITEFYLRGFVINKKNILYMIQTFTPFLIVFVGYLYFRNWYGGAPHDFFDGMVQLRISLLGQGMYAEYLWRGLLSFGRYASSHAVAYPLVNMARDIAAKFFYAPLVLPYFFPFVGMIYIAIKLTLLFVFRKDKKVRNILLFAFLWFLIPTIFFSFAFTITDSELERPLVWSYTRWRYFAFFGTVLFWVTVFWKTYEVAIKKHRRIVPRIKFIYIAAIAMVLFTNLYFLRIIQREMYIENFKFAKDFYQSLTQRYKTLPEDYVFYYFPYAPGLSDRLAEFYYLRRKFYPNLTAERRDFTEGHMGMILDQLQLKHININSLMFLDLDQNGQFLDRTSAVKSILSRQEDYTYQIQKVLSSEPLSSLDEKGLHQVSIPLDPQLHVEFPYTIEITLRAVLSDVQVGTASMTNEQRIALKQYSRERIELLKNTKVSVCKTAPLGSRGAEAMHLLPRNIIDGNIGKRSFWMADCRPAWVTLDFGRIKNIGGMVFRGELNAPSIPSEYTVEVSRDGKAWEKVLHIKHNEHRQGIQKFSKVKDARFAKFTALRTTQGGMLTLDTLEAIGEDGLLAVDYYSGDFERLLSDSHAYGFPHLRFSWNTEPNNFALHETLFNNSIYIPLVVDGLEHTYTIQPNEGEFYSASGQFLKRYITQVNLDMTGSDFVAEVSTLKISPVFKVVSTLVE